MQNPTFTNISPISERILALIAEGAGSFKTQEDVTQCRKCPLSQNRSKVLISTPILPKKFFVLSEYADRQDESSSQELFHPQSSSGIILNLVKKLGIAEQCHFSFALKCVPHKHTPEAGLTTCVTQNLLKEIKEVQPSVLFCFGARIFYALASLDPGLFYQAYMPKNEVLPSFSKEFSLNLNKYKMTLFLLPTSQELKQFPQWRTSVWEQLERFRVVK